MLTVMEFARKHGIDGGSDHATRQRTLRRLRRMERATGRSLLVETGCGNGRRFLVRDDADDVCRDNEGELSEIANAIATQIEIFERRHGEMVTGLASVRAAIVNIVSRLERLERRFGAGRR